MGSRKHDAPPIPASARAWLTAALTLVVVLVLLFYPRVASDGALRSSARADAASFEVSTQVRSDADQRLLAGPSVAALAPALDRREWSASTPADVIASAGTAVNLPAGLTVTAVAWEPRDDVPQGPTDGVLPASITEADAAALSLSPGDTFAVGGMAGTVRLSVASVVTEGRDAALLTAAAPADRGVGLAVAVAPSDLALFSASDVVGWQFFLPSDASAALSLDAADRLAALPAAITDAGAAPGGVTASGDLPAILAEASTSYRALLNLVLNGVLLVALVGTAATVQVHRRMAADGPALPIGRTLPVAAVAIATVAMVLPRFLPTSGAVPPLSVAPSVIVVLAAVLLALVLPRCVLALGSLRAVRLRRSLLLATRRVGRRPLPWYPVAFAVAVAVSAGLAGATVLGSAQASGRAAAELQNGGDVRAVFPSASGSRIAVLSDGAVPADGAVVSRVLRMPTDADGEAAELVAVEAATLPGLLTAQDVVDADRLSDALQSSVDVPEPALDLRPTARQVRLQVRTSPRDAGGSASTAVLRAQVDAWLAREDGTLSRVAAGTLTITPNEAQQHSLSFSIPDDRAPEEIAALDFSIAAGPESGVSPDGFSLSLISSSSDTGIGTGESRFAAESKLRVVASLPASAEAGVTDADDGPGFSLSVVPAEPLTVRLAVSAPDARLPLAVSPSVGLAEGDAVDLLVDDAVLPGVVAEVTEVPGVAGGSGIVADLRSVSRALLTTAAGPPEPVEAWTSGPDRESLLSALREAAPEGTRITTPVVDPLGASLVLPVALVVPACFIGALGMMAGTRRARSAARAHDAEVLAALGVSRPIASGAQHRNGKATARTVLAVKRLPLPGDASLDVSVRSGETVGVIGSRAQLDAVARAVTGVAAVDTGSVAVLGRSFSSMRAEDRRTIRSASIGSAAAQWPLLAWLTIEENIEMAVSPDRIGQDSEEALRAFDLASSRHVLPSDLPSSLHAERVRLARAAANRPPVLVWQPEPGLPPESVAGLLGTVRSFLGSEAAVLILVDDAMDAAAADRIVDLSSPSSPATAPRPAGRLPTATTHDVIEVPQEYRKGQRTLGEH
ncbi:hypothetical protein FDK12_00790 [Arthrobacter sp. NamB2]|uniref:hypothetical protein n=1 Tax=Arthrobacter sp. NamB2 TaxID=2576035 RepID=UPI0010C97631|nr:hypothetical protein [Arthrobacter sp. NamB2]TKV29511.1 hypothetical protein FDK12_00790 [Arthrobacter sp. NamB2]